MSERRLTLISGDPGIEARRVGQELEYQDPRHIEFISIGNLVRSIGAKAVSSSFESDVTAHMQYRPHEPLSDALASDLTYEALGRADMSHHVLLEGFPRRIEQIDDLYELAQVTQRSLTGMIHLTTSDTTAIKYIMQHKNVSNDAAQRELQTARDIHLKLHDKLDAKMNIYSISADGDQTITDQMAFTALRELAQQEVDLTYT